MFPTVPSRPVMVLAAAVVTLGLLGACSSSDSTGSGPTKPPGTSSEDASTASDTPERTVVFEGGEGGIDTFRIPAVGVTPKGTVVVVAEARSRSPLDTDPHHLVSKRSTDGGRTWESITDVARANHPIEGCFPSNPVVTVPTAGDAAGDLIVVFNPCRDGGGLSQVRSTDDGESWSDPEPLGLAATEAVPATEVDVLRSGPGHGIQLTGGPADGRVVMVADAGSPGQTTTLALLLSDDGGATWRIGASTTVAADAALDPDESAVAQLPDGTLLVSSRSASAASSGRIQMLASSDGEQVIPGPGGAVLSNAPDLEVPGVEGSVLLIPEQERVVFSSPSDPEFRRGLRLWTTANGLSWQAGPVLVPGPAAYSDLARLDDATLAVVVETGDRNPYQRIDFAPVRIDTLDDEGPALPPEFDVADAVAGRLVVDGTRYPVTRFCLISDTVELDGGEIQVDTTGGLGAVRVDLRLDGTDDAGSTTLAGTIALDLSSGITYRGPLTDSSGNDHDIDLVIVNMEPCPN